MTNSIGDVAAGPVPAGQAGGPVGLVGADAQRVCSSSFLGALVDIGPAVPTVAAVASLFAYVGMSLVVSGDVLLLSLALGVVAALAISLLSAAVYRLLFTAADRAYPQTYSEIRQR